ncbi:MAG: hypothetical protein L0227_04840 [Chloroflexi bacterium]|nr:hypothetical protein [Chloroflexota bacterium]
MRAVVRRYGDSIDAWEVWNEPNHPKFWLPKPDPEAYAALLAVAAEVIRSEDPGATILLGGIVGTDVRYLDRLRAAGAWSDFDVLALHGYVRLSPEASGLGGWFDRAMAYVARHGSKPVWLTEICWPIAPAEPGIPEVTAGLQAAYLGRTYARAAEAGLARVFWYSLIDHPSGTGSRYDACGTFDVGQQARSTYQALRTIGAAFDGSVTMGPYDPAATSRLAVDPAGGRWRAASGSSITVLTGTLSAAYRLVSTTDSAAFTTSLPLPGRPTSLAATVTGDGSANSILASFTDATGERCSASFAALRSESRSIRLPLDGTAANWRCSGGDGDQRLDAPVRLSSLAVYPTGIGELSGSFRLTGLSVGEGPVDRGIVLAHGTSLRLLVSRSVASSGATTAIVLPGGIATELVDGATRVLTVERGRLRLGVGPQIRAVDVPLGLTHRTITPPEYTWLRWLAGDGTNARPQVTGPDGRWVKTAPSKVWRPGVQSIAWDGRVATSDGRRIAAPPGRYTIRLVVTAPDGRVGTLQASVDVR